MAIEIKKIYTEHFPSVRFIGKSYSNSDRINGTFAAQWNDWGEKNLFAQLEKLPKIENMDNGCFGLMCCAENHFQYWIGMMFPQNTVCPAGFSFLDIPACAVGICWIYGNAENGEIYGEDAHNLCLQKLLENKIGVAKDNFNGEAKSLFFERYNCPRFTEKDAHGNVILDYGIYIE